MLEKGFSLFEKKLTIPQKIEIPKDAPPNRSKRKNISFVDEETKQTFSLYMTPAQQDILEYSNNFETKALGNLKNNQNMALTNLRKIVERRTQLRKSNKRRFSAVDIFDENGNCKEIDVEDFFPVTPNFSSWDLKNLNCSFFLFFIKTFVLFVIYKLTFL